MTSVDDSDAPVVVPIRVSNEDFTQGRKERWGLVAIGILVIGLAAVVLRASDSSINRIEMVSDTNSTTGNVVIVQRESLVFLVGYEQWLSGTITRRQLQIRRALLAQRLAVRDYTGVINGERVPPEYLKALGVLDNYMDAGPTGLLPHDDQTVMRLKSAASLQSFIFESRQLVAQIAAASDEQTRQILRDENSRRTKQYQIVLAILALMSIVASFLAFSRSRDYRKIRLRMVGERQNLDKLNSKLNIFDNELQSRIEQERTESVERQWLASATRSVSSKFDRTVSSEKIAELLAEGLGRELRADIVICYSFDDLQLPGFVRQWHRRADTQVEEPLILSHASRLSALVNRLWSRKRVVIVSDSHLIDVSVDSYSDLVALTRERFRSWVFAPVADGSSVLGCVMVAMMDDARDWSWAEVALTQQTALDAATVCIHARMFKQSMKIAENDAEVSRLVELDNAKSDFIENMNHELRTPLTSIIGYLEVALDDIDAGAEPAMALSLTVVQRNALRLQLLIENMMQISKRDFEHVPLAVAKVDVGFLLGDGVNSLQLAAEDCGVTMKLQFDSPAGDLIIDGDHNQLEQVFVNLMSNSIKFTPRGGTVTVVAGRYHAVRDCVEVKVVDTGIGISVEDFPNVFKRFFRASTAVQALIPGFGIGLSLVHSIVREHRGTVTFDSTVGEGTVFTVTLPVQYTSTTEVGQTT